VDWTPARIIAVTDAGLRIVAEGTRIADRVHCDALGALPEEQRVMFMEALRRLIEGHLPTPVEAERPVRRSRQRRV
jgi:hypothetical protein